jgi:flagellar hook-associated protein 3 FlgL
MRIADKMAFEQVKGNVAKNRQTMAELQNQAATQKRVTKPSDDPLAAARVLGHRVDLQGNKQYTKSLGYARSFLEYTDQSLSEITESLVRAKELAISQSSDGAGSEESRRVVATEISQLHDQLVQVANRKLGDRFIFGGYKTQVSPFDKDGNYFGDRGEMLIHVDKDAFLAMNVPGSRVFLGDGFDINGPHFTTPEQAKTIEDFQAQKQRTNELLEQDPNANPNLRILPSTNMEMRSPASQNNTDMRSPASETNPEGRSPASISTVADNVAMETGKTTGSVNLFRILRDLETSLRTNDKGGVQNSLESIDQALQQVVLTRAQVGARSTTLDHFTEAKEKEKVEDQIAISNLEDTDIYATVSDINKTEATLQATLQTSGKMIQKSLMDFIR